MKIKRTLLPNQPGTKALVEKYGKNLVCVRYRYDEERNKKITTAEIIVNEKDWERDLNRIPANKIMFLKVMYGEVHVANLIKAAGGRWNRRIKLWELAYREIVALGLEDRMVNVGDERQ
jgi:hypothetical protein